MKQDLNESLGAGKLASVGNTRKAGKEQYYTPVTTAHELVKEIKPFIPAFTERTFIEPAAGTGSFLEALQANGAKRVLAFDVEPKAENIIRADFLKDNVLPRELLNAVSITNPPFGRNSSLSIPFFNLLANHCVYIGFVVPKSWRKWSVQDRLDERFHLVHDRELSINYVDEHDEEISSNNMLRTVFQLWQRKETPREKVIVKPTGLFRKVSLEEANAALTIFGRTCGTLKTEFPVKPNSTSMYLKVDSDLGFQVLENADFAQFYNNVATVEALSWNEINYAAWEWLESQGINLEQ